MMSARVLVTDLPAFLSEINFSPMYVLISIIGLAILIYLIYYVLSYYYDLKRQYYCVSVNNLVTGDILQCFNDPPEHCKDINPNIGYGWCQDPEYFGAYAGSQSGPYGFECTNWIWNHKKCPPLRCQGQYPIGIRMPQPDKQIQEYGWCADPEINRAMKGSSCGPSRDANADVECQNWIWSEASCPQTCPLPSRRAPKKAPPVTKPDKNSKCSLVCGTVDGKTVACPPPCKDGEDSCLCKPSSK
jgi:hypothetical protein